MPNDDLNVSFNEYRGDKAEVPYINIIIDKSALTKEEFEHIFNMKFRERRRIIEESLEKGNRGQVASIETRTWELCLPV